MVSLFMLVFATGMVNAAYPDRPINVYVGFPAGGPTDVIARGIVPILEEKLGNPVAITNMPGAASATAASFVLKQKADGYSLFMGSEIMSIWQTMDIMDISWEDYKPIKLIAKATPVIAVPPDSPFDTAEEFVEYAIDNPGELRISIAGPGTIPHISGLLLQKVLGAEFTFVPYQGGKPAVTAVMGGQVDATIEMVQSMVAAYKGEKLKILASFTNEPIPGLEEITPFGKLYPAVSEYLPYGPYFGLFAQKGVSEEVVDVLEKGMSEAIKDPRWTEYCEKFYLTQIDYSGEEAVEFLEAWTSKSAWILYDTGGAKNSPADFGIPRPEK